MSNKFNVRLSFKGEGDLTFQLPIVGEVTIWAGRDIFLVGATTEIVETLRQYRSMKLEHKLNADSKGCYKVIEVDNIDRIPYGLYRPVAVPKAENISDLKKTLIRSNDFIPVDEAGKSTAEELKVKQEAQQKEELDKIPTSPTVEDITPEGVNDSDNLKESEEILDDLKESEDLEVEKKELPENLADYVVKTTKERGKKLSELDEKALKKLARYSNDDNEKAKAKEALDILFGAE